MSSADDSKATGIKGSVGRLCSGMGTVEGVGGDGVDNRGFLP